MSTISLCVTCRNEEENMSLFLKSIMDFVDEIIFVDTGSSDKTLEIARGFGCKIFNFKQENDDWIEEARNLALQKATKDWILALDPDEIISSADFGKIKDIIEGEEGKEYIGFYLIQRQYINEIGIAGWKSSKDDIYKESKIASGWYENPILRLFKNDKRIKYEGRPHDLVDWSVKKIGKTCLTDIPIHHFGELNRKTEEKADRNIKFLKQHLADTLNKEKFYTYYQLACEFIGKNELVEAEENLKTSIKLNEFYAPSLRNLAALYLKQKKYKEAEELLLKSLNVESNASTYNHLGVIYSEKNELSRALKKFEKALELNPSSADYNFNIGLVYLKMKKDKKAIPYFEKAIELNPEYKNRIKFD